MDAPIERITLVRMQQTKLESLAWIHTMAEKSGNLHTEKYGKQKKASLPSEKAHALNYGTLRVVSKQLYEVLSKLPNDCVCNGFSK